MKRILDDAALAARLQRPAPGGRLRMVLDTDAYNEVDDQFALCLAMLSPERLEVEGIYAAPFENERSKGFADGMERSYQEILRLLKLLNVPDEEFVFRGSEAKLPGPREPVESPAARALIAAAKKDDPRPLYVVTIGVPTNVASAILLEPAIAEKIVVVWLGGHAPWWPDANEFNLMQDLHASRVLFDSGVPLVQLPCCGVVTHMATTLPELAAYIKGKNPLCDYLYRTVEEVIDPASVGWSRVIWDAAAVAWLVNPGWFIDGAVPSPILTDRRTYSADIRRHPIRMVTMVHRDPVFADLFGKLAAFGQGGN